MDTMAEPEKSAYELERGKPMPSFNHSVIQPQLVIALSRFQDRYTISCEPTLIFSGVRFTPDVALFPAQQTDWSHDQYPIEKIPLLAIEILSPTQGFNSMIEKLDAYFAHGVKSTVGWSSLRLKR